MPSSEFERHVEGAINNRLEEDRSIHEEAARFFAEVESRQYVFDRPAREAAALRAIKQQEFASWAREVLLGSSVRRLSVHVRKGSKHAEIDVATCSLPEGASLVHDPVSFKAKLRCIAA